jgi:hypothetical protein
MDEKDFKKHLQDLAHGHHHPAEHDWPEKGTIQTVEPASGEPAKKKPAARRSKRSAKR